MLDRVTKVCLAMFLGWTIMKWMGLNTVVSELWNGKSETTTA